MNHIPPRYGMPGMYPPAPMGPMGLRGRSLVTLSGLLNVLDGVGSEEGKLFFATVRLLFLGLNFVLTGENGHRRTI